MNPAVTLAYALTLRITFHKGDSLYTRVFILRLREAYVFGPSVCPAVRASVRPLAHIPHLSK